MERDSAISFIHSFINISTHTLTWSVTVYFTQAYDDVDISTHTLTWSVTGVPQTWGGDYHNFNSHAHVERDIDIS